VRERERKGERESQKKHLTQTLGRGKSVKCECEVVRNGKKKEGGGKMAENEA
jgi:hypothetical protein